jgi:hypothetical protein
LVGIDADGAKVPVEKMSTGTTDSHLVCRAARIAAKILNRITELGRAKFARA